MVPALHRFSLLIVPLVSAAGVLAAPTSALARPPAPGDLLVGVSARPGAAAAAAGLGRSLAPGVRLVPRGTVSAARLRHAAGVRWVEPNRTFRAAAVPNDPLLPEQWALAQPEAAGVQDAWRSSVGGAVTVAVLDTGVDVAHPDLAPNLWRNPGEVPGNGRDDDGDGVVDDVNGADAITGSGKVSDPNGHGTAVAGIAGARGNNGIGGSGVAQDARLMAVRVLDANAEGTTATLVAGMRFALVHGARVINLSLTGADRSTAVEEQIQAAQARGVLVVAAAGNEGRDLDHRPSYPAAYPESNVIGVAATGATGALSSFSNRGAGVVDLAAPGEGVLGPAPGGGYARWSGTSDAAPEVAGAAVLLEAASPGASADAVRDALLAGARRVPALTGQVAAGELDVGAAMRRMAPTSAPAPAPASAHVRLSARRSRIRAGRVTLRWQIRGERTAVAAYRLELSAGPPLGRGARRRSGRVTSWTLHLRPGRWRWRLVALDAQGRSLSQLRGTTLLPTRG